MLEIGRDFSIFQEVILKEINVFRIDGMPKVNNLTVVVY